MMICGGSANRLLGPPGGTRALPETWHIFEEVGDCFAINNPAVPTSQTPQSSPALRGERASGEPLRQVADN